MCLGIMTYKSTYTQSLFLPHKHTPFYIYFLRRHGLGRSSQAKSVFILGYYPPKLDQRLHFSSIFTLVAHFHHTFLHCYFDTIFDLQMFTLVFNVDQFMCCFTCVYLQYSSLHTDSYTCIHTTYIYVETIAYLRKANIASKV